MSRYGDRNNHFQNSLEIQLASQAKKTTAYRRVIDPGANIGRWVLKRKLGRKRPSNVGSIRPEASYTIDLLPPSAYKKEQVVIDTQTKFVHLSANKSKHAINAIKFTPEGRRLLVAMYSGEFTLWNGSTFNFENLTQAHDSAILALEYSHNDEWLLSADQEGTLKFWQTNFNNVNILQAHEQAIRDVAFAPGDSKFVTASDDSSLKIWNFSNAREERVLKGHNWDVKSTDWHPSLGLIVSGSKDNLLKLWDPRVGTAISTLHGFKHTITKTRFQPGTGSNLLATISRDKSMRIFDLRAMKDIFIHRSEVDLTALCWNPVHTSTLTTGCYDGSLHHYMLSETVPESMENIHPAHTIPYAHEKVIHAIDYHPLGHIMSSAGADRTTRFWSRGRPNDPNAFNDPPYTNDKNNAWYFAINNSVNAVVPKNENVGGQNQDDRGGRGGYPGLGPANIPGLHY